MVAQPNDIGTVALSHCPECQSTAVIRYGSRKGKQIWYCKSCKKRHIDNGALPGRRIPPVQVGAAVALFYEGHSLEEVRRSMGQIFDSPPSTGSIYEWIEDYTKVALHETRAFKPKLGKTRTWVCDEQVQRVGGKKLWNWNVMDADTRFLLATRLSPTRGTRDAELVLRKAKAVAGRAPRFVLSDRLGSYPDGVERAFGSKTRHISSDGLRADINNNLSERLQGTMRAREKVMRGMKSQETAQVIMDGWALHYNYFRPHESLKGKTPAEAAGLDYRLRNWEDVARLDVRPFSHKRSQLERKEFRERQFAEVLPVPEPLKDRRLEDNRLRWNPPRERRFRDRTFSRSHRRV